MISAEKRHIIARRARQLVLFLVFVMVVISVALVAGPIKNDITINRDKASTVATVQHAGPVKTVVSFRDDSGEYQSPAHGVFYPGGLEKGQRVWVEYSRSNPDVARVQGRTWQLAVRPALSTLLLTLIVGWLAGYGITRWEKWPSRRKNQKAIGKATS